jgi:HAD superfamily hydrolase (TIGR01509 family)
VRVPVTWVAFDLGYTLVDEASNWDRWADFLDVDRFTFHAMLGAVIAERRPHTDVFGYFRPDLDLHDLFAAKAATGVEWTISDSDLYEDAIPTLTQLREQGYRLAVVANQPPSAEAFMATLPVDLVATSAGWGVSKPDPRFFARLVEAVDVGADQICYVGDRLDNDVLPAQQAGMLAVHLRRGPWGFLHAMWPEATQADLRIDTLAELLPALRGPIPARSGRGERSWLSHDNDDEQVRDPGD